MLYIEHFGLGENRQQWHHDMANFLLLMHKKSKLILFLSISVSVFKFLQVEAGFCKFQRIFANFSESMRDMTCLNMISEKID